MNEEYLLMMYLSWVSTLGCLCSCGFSLVSTLACGLSEVRCMQQPPIKVDVKARVEVGYAE